MKLTEQDIANLYSEDLYVIDKDGQDEATPPEEKSSESKVETITKTNYTGSIQWKPRPGTKVFFILTDSEIRNKELGELLKKIVESVGIPFAAAGFGIINGEVDPKSLLEFDAAFGIAFGKTYIIDGNNPAAGVNGELFYASTLQELAENTEEKRALWDYLKGLKGKID